MKPILIVAAILFLEASRVQGQAPSPKPSRFYITASGGLAFAYGKLTNESADAQKKGLAHSGPNGTLAVGVHIAGPLSVGLTAAAWSNTLNEQKAIPVIEAQYSSLGFKGTTINSDSWRAGALLLTPKLSWALGQRLAFDVRLHVGMMAVRQPAVALTGSIGPVAVTGNLEQQSANGLAYGGGVSLRYALVGPLQLLVGVDGILATPKFSDAQIAITASGQTLSLSQGPLLSRVGTLNAHLGVGFFIP